MWINIASTADIFITRDFVVRPDQGFWLVVWVSEDRPVSFQAIDADVRVMHRPLSIHHRAETKPHTAEAMGVVLPAGTAVAALRKVGERTGRIFAARANSGGRPA